ncbi:hypothetical protein ISS07_00815 [Candidatus Woesearchaeota archaeon]|nr:hypothetical protein [Candidatus Woesearchaeota archaeon]
MNSLESILEISAAIRNQKRGKEETLPSVVENILQTESKHIDISQTKTKEEKKEEFFFNNKILNSQTEKNEGSYLASVLKDYISGVKEKMYDYYSSTKNSVKDIVKSVTEKIKRTDKFLQEFEDWGVIYFKTSFRKLLRLTPSGMMARYQQKLWLYVSKTVK